jgi:predicted ATPase
MSTQPSVKLLATSREQLNLRPEWAFEVHGLPIPHRLEPDHLESNSAAALFIQRARQTHMQFTPAPEELPAIIRICQLVDGLPLGIELAASWVRRLSTREIAQEIESNIDFLRATARDLPARHRSIRAVFDHSWRLLSVEEQQVLMGLSVFHGGFTREAAGQVAGATLLILSSLVDKSLIRRSGPGRYDLHELIRQYAAMRLIESSQHDTVRGHAEYFLTLFQMRETGLRSRLQKETLAEMRPDIDNLRAAWDYAVANTEIDLLHGAISATYYFYELHQYFQEAVNLYQRGIEMARTQLARLGANGDATYRAKVAGALGNLLTHRAFFLQRMGQNREARELHHASIELLKPLDEPYPLTHAYVLCGALCWAVGELTEAMACFNEGLPLSQALENPWLEAVALCFLGATLYDQGHYDDSFARFQEAMAICNEMGDPYITLLISAVFSRTAQALGRLPEAQELLRESLQTARESNNRWGVGLGLEQLAATAQATGDLAEAQRLLEESIAIYHEVGDPWSHSRALNVLTHVMFAQSNLTAAESTAVKAFQISRETEYNLNALEALAALAEIYAMQGRERSAFALALFVLAHTAGSQKGKDRAAKLRDRLQSQLTLENVAVIQARVGTYTLETIWQEIVAIPT